jgi:hypothetical protein
MALESFETPAAREISQKLINLQGCWIDGAIPRTPKQTVLKMVELAEELFIPTVSLLQELDEYDEDDLILFDEMIEELDGLINDALMPFDFIALWEHGDYVLLGYEYEFLD